MLSMLLIVASVIISCLETMEYFSESQSTQNQVIHILEMVCVIWFTAEILIRFIACPSKRKFMRQIMNWVDFAAIIPFYVQLFLSNTDMNSIVSLRIIRLIRVFRVFKLSRHSYSLQILGHTLRSSLSELFLLGFFLSIGVVVFSTLMFYAEHESKTKKFSSIPAGFWWAVVTMTTLGYGDIVPDTLPGKIVGTACAICGVLTIALPIPVIVSNFSLYYSHAKAKQKASQRKRPLVIGAANALKVIDPFVGSRATNLRLSGMSENVSYMSPISRVKNWPRIALDTAGSSFESSEPPGSPDPRRLSKLPDKLWQFDQIRYSDNNRKSVGTTKSNDELSTTENSEDSSDRTITNSEECKTVFPQSSENTPIQPSKTDNSRSVTAYEQDKSCQDLGELSHSHDSKTCQGAYQNEAIEGNYDNENPTKTVPALEEFEFEDNKIKPENNLPYQNVLPKIEIVCNSSASQMSGSNNEDDSDRSQWKPTKKRKKRPRQTSLPVEKKATSTPVLTGENQSFSGKQLPGRMGRRGSVFVVGFLGKRWQAKAARSRRNRTKSKPDDVELSTNKSSHQLLQVSPSISSRRNTPNNESASTSTTTSSITPNSSISTKSMASHFSGNPVSSELSFFRRSSCPNLSTLNISEDKIDLNLTNNNHTRQEVQDHYPTRYCGLDSVDRRNLNGICGDEKFDTNPTEAKTLSDDTRRENHVNTKHHGTTSNHNDFGSNHKEIETNFSGTECNETDMRQGKEERKDYEYFTSEKSTSTAELCSPKMSRKLSEEGIRLDLKSTKCGINSQQEDSLSSENDGPSINDAKSKTEKLRSKRHSFSSYQSDSSLKAQCDETARRSSSPLIRQRALISCPVQNGEKLHNSDDDIPSCIGICLEKRFDGNDNGIPNKSENDENFSSVKTPKRNTITLMEIGKNQLTNTEHNRIMKGQNDTPKLPRKEQVQNKNSSSSTVKKTFVGEYIPKIRSPVNGRQAFEKETTFESKLGVSTHQITTNIVDNKLTKNKSNEDVQPYQNNLEDKLYLKSTQYPLVNGHKNEKNDDHCDKTNGVPFKDENENEKDGMTETSRSIHQPLTANYKKKNIRKCETIDIPEHKDIAISSANNLSNESTTNISNDFSKRSDVSLKNLAYTKRRYHSLSSSIASQSSAEYFTSLECTTDSNEFRKVEAQDSGIYCSEYRSSIDSLSSSNERNYDRGMLNTISEVEYDFNIGGGLPFFQPSSDQLYGMNRSHILEIRDETAV